jgi:hypothetical protein
LPAPFLSIPDPSDPPACEFGRKRWGGEGYAMEEIVAEPGSAFLSH